MQRPEPAAESPAAESPAAESPAELVERVRAGDAAAEERLVERYARGLRIVLERHTRDLSEAEDLFQETFRLAFEKLRAGELREPAKLPGFLSSLGRNLAIEHYRKIERRRTDTDSPALEAISAPTNPLGDLLRDEEARLVRRALEDLPTDRDREILFRFYIAEDDKDAIATDYGLTGQQLSRLLYRARQRYKALLVEKLEALAATSSNTPLVEAAIAILLTVGAMARLLITLKS